MKLIYPVLWSRLSREAQCEQTVSTAAALSRQGVSVTLLAPRRSGDPELDGESVRAYFDVRGDFKVIQRPWSWVSPQAVPSTLWLRRALRDPEVRSADVLLSRIPAMLAAGRACPIPFVTDHYRPWPDHLPILRPLIRATAKAPHCLGTVLHSEFATDSYLRCGVPTEKLLVAHNGADLDRFEPRLTRAEARRTLGLDPERPVVVYAGRVNASKGLDQVLALAALRPEVSFLLVGSEGDGPVERAARKLANVRVIGWQKPRDLSPYLFAADVLVVPPSRAPLERFGNCVLPIKLFAYFAAERPILAPQSADTAGFLRHGENAWLVPPEQPQLAAEALDRLLADASLTAALGASALAEARLRSWDRRAEVLLRFVRTRLGRLAADVLPSAAGALAPSETAAH